MERSELVEVVPLDRVCWRGDETIGTSQISGQESDQNTTTDKRYQTNDIVTRTLPFLYNHDCGRYHDHDQDDKCPPMEVIIFRAFWPTFFAASRRIGDTVGSAVRADGARGSLHSSILGVDTFVASPARFDFSGPKTECKVERGESLAELTVVAVVC